MEKQQFWGHWRWVHIRRCSQGHITRILGGDTRCKPSLPTGAVRCSQCTEYVVLGQGVRA